MEFRDQKVILTPSEAQWAQQATMLLNRMPGLSQKILDARIAFVKTRLSSYQKPAVSVRAARSDIVAHQRLSRVLEHLHEAALQHATNEANEEKHVIAVPMDENEKRGLLALAREDSEITQERLEAPEVGAIEREAVRGSLAMFVATSDAMSPEQAVAFSNLRHDPETNADFDRSAHKEAVQHAAVTTSVIMALEADLAK